MEGITKTGFEFKVEVELLDDWDVLDMLAEMQKGNMLVAPDFVRKVFGKDQGKALIEHCRVDGRVPTEKVLAEVFDVFGQIREGKNSSL